MALGRAKEVPEQDLEKVAGGLQKTNMIKRGYFHIGMKGHDYAYTYPSDRDGDVESIISGLDYSGCATEADRERLRIDALKAVPGLLTAIPGLDPSCY